MSNICLPLPTLREQSAIVDRLNSSLIPIDKARKSIDASIERLREYRSSLITAAVTGQIDVTTWTTQVAKSDYPEQIEEAMRA
jgi:type I restriction enzyme S subunit